MPEIRDIVSSSRKAAWQTFTPQSVVVPITEQIAVNRCSAAGSWDQLSTAWLTSTLHPGILVRNAKQNGEWVFCLGSFGTSAALGWPITQQVLPHGVECSFRRVSSLSDLSWLVCSDPADWQAQEIRWLSPLHTMAARGAAGLAEIVCITVGQEMPLMHLAAHAAFWNFSSVQLQRIAEHFRIPVGKTLLARITGLVEAILSPTPDQMLDILEKRLVSDQLVVNSGASAHVLCCGLAHNRLASAESNRRRPCSWET